MGLMETFQKAATTIVTAFGDVAERVTYTTEPTQHQDPVTFEITETVQTYDLQCIKGTLTQRMSERITSEEQNIRAGDTVFYVPAEQVTFEVANKAKITRNNGEVWYVVHPQLLPADAMWILICKKVFNG